MQGIRPQYTSDGVLSGLCKQGSVTRPKNTTYSDQLFWFSQACFDLSFSRESPACQETPQSWANRDSWSP